MGTTSADEQSSPAKSLGGLQALGLQRRVRVQHPRRRVEGWELRGSDGVCDSCGCLALFFNVSQIGVLVYSVGMNSNIVICGRW